MFFRARVRYSSFGILPAIRTRATIPVRCDQRQNETTYALWLAGMRVQCKACKGWLDIPLAEGSKPPTPAPAVAVPSTAPARPAPAVPPPPPWREARGEASGGSDAGLAAITRMNVVGLEGMTDDDLRDELARGGRFVVYQYCVSLLVVSFKRSSGIRFIRADRSRVGAGAPYSLLSAVIGWWGLPWGAIFTFQCLAGNLAGGQDVTDAVLASLGWQRARA